MKIETSIISIFEDPLRYQHRVYLTVREASRRIYRHLRTAHDVPREEARRVVRGFVRWHTETPVHEFDEVLVDRDALDRYRPLAGLLESVDELARRLPRGVYRG